MPWQTTSRVVVQNSLYKYWNCVVHIIIIIPIIVSLYEGWTSVTTENLAAVGCEDVDGRWNNLKEHRLCWNNCRNSLCCLTPFRRINGPNSRVLTSMFLGSHRPSEAAKRILWQLHGQTKRLYALPKRASHTTMNYIDTKNMNKKTRKQLEETQRKKKAGEGEREKQWRTSGNDGKLEGKNDGREIEGRKTRFK